MPEKIGQFFDIFILKQAVETQYLGGLDQFIADVGPGEINEDLNIFGTRHPC